MRLIDADALRDSLFNDTQYGFWHDSMDGSDVAYTQRDLFKCLDAMPTIDAVPVVRCKDCKYCVFHSGADWCIRWRAFPCVKPDDFCSYGERKDGEG